MHITHTMETPKSDQLFRYGRVEMGLGSSSRSSYHRLVNHSIHKILSEHRIFDIFLSLIYMVHGNYMKSKIEIR